MTGALSGSAFVRRILAPASATCSVHATLPVAWLVWRITPSPRLASKPGGMSDATGYATCQARPYTAWCNPIQCFSWFARSLLAKQKDARPKHQDSPWAGNDRRYVQFLDNLHKMRKVLLNDFVQIIQMLVDCACQVVEYLVGLLGGRKIGTSDYAG